MNIQGTQFCVYILASKRNGTIYVGITNDLKRRVLEHKEKVHKRFTEQYDVTRLVYFECSESREVAINREKQIKGWKRAWKIELFEKDNPGWLDLYDEL